MNDEDPTMSSANELALDAALTQALRAPPLPATFRVELNAALQRVAAAESTERQRLDAEYRARMTELEMGYVRLRQRTLGTLIGGAFAAGVAVALLMPWFNATFGANATFALAIVGAVIGVGISAASWVRSVGLPNPLEIF
jgi:hypothetical protein